MEYVVFPRSIPQTFPSVTVFAVMENVLPQLFLILKTFVLSVIAGGAPHPSVKLMVFVFEESNPERPRSPPWRQDDLPSGPEETQSSSTTQKVGAGVGRGVGGGVGRSVGVGVGGGVGGGVLARLGA